MTSVMDEANVYYRIYLEDAVVLAPITTTFARYFGRSCIISSPGQAF